MATEKATEKARWRVTVEHPEYPGPFIYSSHAESPLVAMADAAHEFERRSLRKFERVAGAHVVAVHR